MVNNNDYGDIKFLASKKDYRKTEKKNSICINVFGYKNGLVYPVHASDQNIED